MYTGNFPESMDIFNVNLISKMVDFGEELWLRDPKYKLYIMEYLNTKWNDLITCGLEDYKKHGKNELPGRNVITNEENKLFINLINQENKLSQAYSWLKDDQVMVY